MLNVANELARAGFVVIGIDDVAHGARQGLVDEKNNYAGSYEGPDGIPDDTGLPLAFFAGFRISSPSATTFAKRCWIRRASSG